MMKSEYQNLSKILFTAFLLSIMTGVLAQTERISYQEVAAKFEAFYNAEKQLPFKGEWTVVWGRDTKELNYHVESGAQKHAFDIVITDTPVS